jgi:NADH-quinone oxidoreductase subunit J
VLFLFIIMLLDLKDEQKRAKSLAPLAAGLSLVIAFVVQLIGVLSRTPDKIAPPLDQQALAGAATHFNEGTKIAAALKEGRLPDVHLIGHTLFTQYNLPFQIIGVLLLVATIGVVVLSKKTAE